MPDIYVDRLRDTPRSKRWTHEKGAHLFTTPGNLGDLHQFAVRLRLKHSWFQANKTMPHYDLSEGKRAEAVRLGAVELDVMQTKDVFRKWHERRPKRKRGRRCLTRG